MSALQSKSQPEAGRRQRARKAIQVLKRLFPRVKPSLHFSNPWELLVAVMLSARCADKKVNEVTEKLFRKYRTLDDYLRAKPKEFEQDIKSTGFYKEKARRILAAAQAIKKRFGGRVPRAMEALLQLPGVGRKTANIVLGAGYGVVEGIAVDTHVRRLARLLGLTDETDPDKIEQDLMKLIPESEWVEFSYRLIEYGRQYCPARSHDHSNCPLSRMLDDA
ncbi:MAG TPA: endonuclease III [Blastocatellia bacterium]|jgi:endonuclease-3|nr:endonuclease III [Blastocatellia bacterium]